MCVVVGAAWVVVKFVYAVTVSSAATREKAVSLVFLLLPQELLRRRSFDLKMM